MMLLKRFYDTSLAQASYLVGCQATGDAIVIDPNRDVDQYLRAASDEGLRITFVTETHIHADFVSGARELAHRSSARLLLSAEGGADWQYSYAADAGAQSIRDGDLLRVGDVQLQVLHTPGHTPEHLTFVVTDTAVTDHPMGAFTGDFLFVGDVGRPDLLERAAGVADSMESSARTLWRSLHRFAALPDHLQIWPGHGAGSVCGKALGAVPFSSLGYERIANWAYAARDEEAFVRHVLEGQVAPPPYFAIMKRMNRDGPKILGAMPLPAALPASALAARVDRGDMIVDVRSTAEYAAAHVPGTLNIPLGSSFPTWAGSFLPYDREVHLLADSEERAVAATRRLFGIGLERVAGWFGSDAIDAWRREGRELASLPQLSAHELADWMGGSLAHGFTVLDVRSRTEWEAGHIPGVPNVPLGTLPDELDRLQRAHPLVVHCQGRSRASIAASLLRARGFRNVVTLAGGLAAWTQRGGALEQGV